MIKIYFVCKILNKNAKYSYIGKFCSFISSQINFFICLFNYLIIPYTSIINFSQFSSCRFSSFAGILFLTFPILLVYLPFLCGSFCLTRVVCQSVGRRLLTGARTIDGRKRHPFSGQPLIAYSISGEGGASWVLLYP